eukprot:TRINITY_DN49444_c0_g1_i1.p1 TRINITY_DN49444_c0_g1~~TRINITY_DN49444_c0_g1_i1.p1  ORF type:complete len:205 (-),score=38.71 TRINITY_DN49444_c0_g1_i1:176-790(-)
MPIRVRELFTGDLHDVIQHYEWEFVAGIAKAVITLDWERVRMLKRSMMPWDESVGQEMLEEYNKPEIQATDLPSAGGLANARSMAKLGSLIGAHNSTLFLHEGVAGMAAGTPRIDEGMGLKVAYTQAGWGVDRFLDYLPSGWVGWAGVAGAVLQWNPSLEIGFAYMPTLANGRVHKPRALRLMREVKHAIDKINCIDLQYVSCD